MENIAFVSVAFREQYVEQIQRLKESIENIYPYKVLNYWVDSWPPNSRTFAESLYGFKVHAVDYLRRCGDKKIIWFDPSCILVDKVEYYFDIIRDYGVLAVRDESKLPGCCGDKAYNYFGVDIQESERAGHHLVGGSLYVFDFDLPLCNTVFEKWKKSEMDGIFGSQHEQATEQINRHRNDESCMALSLYTSGTKPIMPDVARYMSSENPIVIKKHFR